MPSRDRESGESRANTWEGYVQVIVTSLILGGIFWVAKETTEMTNTMGVVLNRLDTLERSIASMDERFDRYQTKAEAASQRENMRLINQILEGRIEGLENKARSRD